MLYVKNVSNKPIGFGELVLLPDESKSLPKGFDEKHPTVAYYLTAKPAPFLVKVDAKAEADRIAAEAKAEADRIAAEKEEADRKAAEAKKLADDEAEAKKQADAKAEADRIAAKKAEELDKQLKELPKMNLEPLQNMATGLGIEWTADDTKAVLQTKITEKLTAEQE